MPQKNINVKTLQRTPYRAEAG